MARFQATAPFSTALVLLIPAYSKVSGVDVKTYPAPDKGEAFNGSFRTYGGSEFETNGLYTVEDTASVETWYRPDIKSDCRVYVPQTDAFYEIVGEPENIELRNQYLKFRVKRIKGGA